MKVDNCLRILDENDNYLMQNLRYFPVVIKSIKGSIITDQDDNEFIDFLSSAASLNLGSCHPVINKAIKDQLDLFSNYILNYIANDKAGQYAKLLTSVYPGGVKAKVAYANSGSGANDLAIKFARAYTKRYKLISFINSYHGTTFGSISISGSTNRMRNNMGPFLPEVFFFKFYGNDVSDEIAEKESTKEMEEAFEKFLPPKEIAAIFIEAIQGDAGILPAHPIFIKKLYNLCKKYGILFIVDDIQQGFFRTGKMYSIENYEGIIPDGITLGKSFGAGLVGSCFMAKAEIIDCLSPPAHMITLGGNPLTCAAGIAAFNIYYSDEFQVLLKNNIKLLDKLGKDLIEKHPDFINKIRNIGMSMGIELKTKDEDITYKIIYSCYEKGLIMMLLAGNVLRVQPPLNIEPENLEKGFKIIDEAIKDYKDGKISDEVLKCKKTW